MQAAEAVVQALQSRGVDTAFGLMGSANMHLVNALARHLRYIGARHESMAVVMAEGYAQATGRVGIATVTSGPAVTNAMTGVATAVRSSTPMVLLAGDVHQQNLQALDLRRALEAVEAQVRIADDPADVAMSVWDATDEAEAMQRPVAVCIPSHVMAAEASAFAPPDAFASAPQDAEHGGWSDIQAAVERLAASERPVIIAGRGALRSDAKEALLELGDRIGALFANTLAARSFFRGHPNDLGLAGGFGSRRTAETIRAADLIVAFGASLNDFTAEHGLVIPDTATIVQIDCDPQALGRHRPVTVGLVGDARETAVRLTAALDADGHRSAGYRAVETSEISEVDRAQVVVSDVRGGVGVDPQVLLSGLNELLPEERTVALDSGHFMGFPAAYVDVVDPYGFVFPGNFGSVGFGIASGIGAAVARPDRLAVVFTGDGGLMMNLGDLETASRYGLKLLVVVTNDDSYGAELHHLSIDGHPAENSVFSAVDFAPLAATLGYRTYEAGSNDEVTSCLEWVSEWLENGDGPALIDVKVDRAIRGGWFARMFDHSAA